MYNLGNKLISLSIIHVFIHTIYHSKKPLGKGVVSLLWYKTISANLYKLQLNGQLWCKSIPSLTHLHPSCQNRPGAYQLQTSRGHIHKAIVKDWLLFKDFGPSIVIKNQGPFSLKVQVFSRIRNFTNSSLLESLLELKFYLVRIKSQTGHFHLMPSQLENVEFYIFLRIL